MSSMKAITGALALAFLMPVAGRADATLSECTQAALEEALLVGGRITIDCDGPLVITNTITVTTDAILDATGSGLAITGPTGTNDAAVRFFTVSPGVSFSLINITLAGGRGVTGGAIFNDRGFLSLESCVLSNNHAIGLDGRNGARGGNSSFQSGGTGRTGGAGQSALGGAIYNFRGETILSECTFVMNAALAGNGGAGGTGGNGYTFGGNGGRGGNGGLARGGAIYNTGTLLATNCSFRSNRCEGGIGGAGGTPGTANAGAGLTGDGGRGGSASGAGVFNLRRSVTFFEACTFSDNTAMGGHSNHAGDDRGSARNGFDGGGSVGGGIANYGTETLINCTFAGNHLSGGNGGDGAFSNTRGGRGGNGGNVWGGNVFNSGRTSATNCTFFDGTGVPGTNGLGGGAPFAGRNGSPGRVRGANLSVGAGVFTLNSCILANPPPATNRFSVTNITCFTNVIETNIVECTTNVFGTIITCDTNTFPIATNVVCTTNITTTTSILTTANALGRFKDGGFNLSSDSSIRFRSTSTSRHGVDPLLASLANNGGPTETIALLEGSLAIDAGDPENCPPTDQRGAPRPPGECDIGAFEFGAAAFPPTISQQPQSRVVALGSNVTFSVVAGGDPPLAYEWRRDGAILDGETNATLTLTNVQLSAAGDYDVVVSNPVDSTTSLPATLTVAQAPAITSQPVGTNASQGASASFSVQATGGAIFYSWRRNGTNLAGATNATLMLTNVQSADAGTYSVVVSNVAGSVTSSNATLAVTIGPVITEQPASTNVLQGQTAVFHVVATGSTLAFQWRRDGNAITGATTATLTLTNVQPADAGAYSVVVSNSAGAVTSSNATLTVNMPPTITEHPAGATVLQGQPAMFRVVATGAEITYHWRHDSNPILGAMANTLTLASAQFADAGAYDVVITNIFGSITSSPAMLMISPAAELILAASVSPTNPAVNDLLVFSISVTNAGPSPATNVVLTCELSVGTQFIGATNTLGGCTNNAGTVTCAVTILEAGSGFVATIDARAGPGTNSCTATVTNIVSEPDFANNSGTASVFAPPGEFANAEAITLEEDNPGPGSPYPSTISVSGLTGRIAKVTVTLRGVTHIFPEDLDILLVGPGSNVMLMSDCGGGDGISDVILTFDDDAPGLLPNGTLITDGTYKPSNYGTFPDAFSSPAPMGPYGSALSAFNDSDPNGNWSLYTYDDLDISGGFIAEGWSLSFTLSESAPAPSPLAGSNATSAAQPAVFHRIRMQPGGTVLLEFSGSPSRVYAVEASSGMSDWQAIGSATADSKGACRFEDTDAPRWPSRFYRAVSQ